MNSICALISRDDALDVLLAGVEIIPISQQPVDEAVGRISAGLIASSPLPAKSIAVTDGWAVRALDLVGASSYSPALLMMRPSWVESGEFLPDECDTVIESAWLDQKDDIFQIVSEPRPGEGTRPVGAEVAADFVVLSPGQKVRAIHSLIATKLGLESLSVRTPRLQIINVSGGGDQSFTAQYIAEAAARAGAVVTRMDVAKTTTAIASAMVATEAHLIVTIGGTGSGKTDVTIDSLRSIDIPVAHGIAITPGRTAAVGRKGDTPIIALPGDLEGALGTWLAVGLPLLDRLTSRERPIELRPIRRKISSAVGVAEVVLLASQAGEWLPLAVGELPLWALSQADAWMLVPADGEGFPAGELCQAYRFGDEK
ncbi:molybdopterin-binding protein [Candidatus Phyllobacterium onerii]|uniref:molybdopterin-binding protein n=1 Tax=Candidatus Phyllobacterium onerii TaxID=3020828 RepID=UPI0023301EC5|nr:molybdopterin-binding protein [Phyllobacterium sp. IY22]